ncbi:MAG: hypothetical protein ABJH28_01875 [Paraglaciecola sp.]|uniref:hypothetical protein n=1 Tax=Paraglaciecola sp. TaxID=1920173 RepID=UPI0032674D0A
MKLTSTLLAITSCFWMLGCSKPSITDNIDVYGYWVMEHDGTIMKDPQPSGLKAWQGGLLTVSDRSAIPSQRLQLRKISANKAQLNGPDLLISLSPSLANSCFATYISGNPDLEALAIDPDDDKVFYLVTEDASGAEPMPGKCQQKYANTGSTHYPRLLIRLEQQTNSSVLMTHVRPIKFAEEMQVGDFPNDGVEALTFGSNRTLYLGIEKDKQSKARIFSLKMGEGFWGTEDFAEVSDLPLRLPNFSEGRHPINGMDFYQTPAGQEFLIAAARNDGKLWVIDLSGAKETRILPLTFYAELKNGSENCTGFEKMHNASIEGVAVMDDTLWLINDPWKKMYPKNIQCIENKENYENYSPLLFSLKVQAEWFQ